MKRVALMIGKYEEGMIKMAKTKIQCKSCKRFFKDDFCDMSGNWETLNNKEDNPNQLCVNCLDRFMTGVDRRFVKRFNDSEHNIRRRMEDLK